MLPPDRIKELSEKHLLVVGAGYVRPLDTTGFAHAIEAEVRKDDEALIRQMLDALTAPVDGDALHALHMSAIAAARAHLLDSDLSKLTERGAKAWAGVDPQKLREGKAP